MAEPIILYDIPGNNAERKAWSPNTWNTRFVLNYKGLPYKTEWIEYPDIKDLCLKIGATPTDQNKEGTPYYSLPVIYDPSTKTVVSDSWDIVRYLEKTYPSAPSLIPKGTEAFHAAFQAALGSVVNGPLFSLVVLPTWKYLNEPGQVYFRTTREADFGKKLEDFAPPGAEQQWKDAEAAFNRLASWLDANGDNNELVTGDKVSYADILIAARLIWGKIVWGEDSKEWATLKTWDGGRWEKISKRFEKYETVV